MVAAKPVPARGVPIKPTKPRPVGATSTTAAATVLGRPRNPVEGCIAGYEVSVDYRLKAVSYDHTTYIGQHYGERMEGEGGRGCCCDLPKISSL